VRCRGHYVRPAGEIWQRQLSAQFRSGKIDLHNYRSVKRLVHSAQQEDVAKRILEE
jgi:hypothetical protein